MVEVVQTDFNEHHMIQVPITENQLGTMQLMEEVSEHVGMNYPEISDLRFVAHPVDDFLFLWEEAGSAENPITIDADEGFSETITLQNTPPLQTTSDGTSFSSAFCRKSPELFCCSLAL